MSQERVDRLLSAYEALNRGDFEAVTASLPDDFEFIPPPMLLESGGLVVRGRARRAHGGDAEPRNALEAVGITE